MFASIRRYKTTDAAEVTRRVNQGFVPLISEQPGFVAYYVLDSSDGAWTSVSIFQDRAGAEHSNQLAADWARQHVADLLVEGPDITAGEVVAQAPAQPGTQQKAA
ncbi:MAG TPA: hypothetical protein VGM23_12770 [Armatimonadota bacterium]